MMTYRYSLTVLSLFLVLSCGMVSCGPRAASGEARPLVSANPAPVAPVLESLDDDEKEIRFLELVRGTRIELPPEGAAIYSDETEVVVSVNYDHPVREVRIGGQRLALDGGKYRGRVSGLTSGLQDVRVEVVDAAGVVAAASARVTIDTTAPRIEIDEPEEGAEVSSRVTVKGRALDDSRLTLKIGSVRIPVDSLGQFSYEIELPPGAREFQITAVDPGGHATIVRRRVVVAKPALSE